MFHIHVFILFSFTRVSQMHLTIHLPENVLKNVKGRMMLISIELNVIAIVQYKRTTFNIFATRSYFTTFTIHYYLSPIRPSYSRRIDWFHKNYGRWTFIVQIHYFSIGSYLYSPWCDSILWRNYCNRFKSIHLLHAFFARFNVHRTVVKWLKLHCLLPKFDFILLIDWFKFMTR